MTSQTEIDQIEKHFTAAVPREWFTGAPRVDVDEEEILCVGRLATRTEAVAFREATRAERVAIAEKAEPRFRRKVSWGIEQDGRTVLFTTRSAPVMTRLRLPERAVLDTLVGAGVARSRSDALAWCVKLVGRHQAEWLADLRDALVDVDRVRGEGPTPL
ncbi:MAG: hypothetical protein ACRDY3_06985 [Acidimicrobiales bacterium]